MQTILQTLVLCAWAKPQNYPHLERHAKILAQKYDRVHVVCIDPQNQVSNPQIIWHSLAPTMPLGVKDYYRYAQKLYQILDFLKPSAVEAIDPPTLMAAGLWCRWNHKTLLYFSMELWRELPSLLHRPIKKRLWSAIEKMSLPPKQCVIATVSQGVAHILEEDLHRPVHVIRSIPWKPQAERNPIDIRQKLAIPQDQFILVYQGLVEAGRGIEPIAEILSQGNLNIHLVVIGDGPILATLKNAYQTLPQVHFLGRMDYQDSLAWIQGADAGLVYIQDKGLSFRHCLPGKVFEYLHAQIPILVSPLPDLIAFVQEHRAGVICADWSAESLRLALQEIQQPIYQTQIQGMAEQLNWENEGQKLLELLAIAES